MPPTTETASRTTAPAALCPDAAQLRRTLDSDEKGIYIHAARPGTRTAGQKLTRFLPEPSKDIGRSYVYRPDGCNFSNLRISPDGLYTAAVGLHPFELRELAACLIDAAHDIEAHPAAALATAGEAA